MKVSMNNDKNWFGRHPVTTYILCILAFLSLVFIAYYSWGASVCAAVSFGLPGLTFAFLFGWENGRTDLLRQQQEPENTGRLLKEAKNVQAKK
jgi:hypothetical protein